MSIRNRINRAVKQQKKKSADRYLKRMGVLFDFYFNYEKVRKGTRKLSLIESKKQGMTNWQNSQWLRAGGHILSTMNKDNTKADSMKIDHFLALTKEK